MAAEASSAAVILLSAQVGYALSNTGSIELSTVQDGGPAGK
jgi:hypothetical protein